VCELIRYQGVVIRCAQLTYCLRADVLLGDAIARLGTQSCQIYMWCKRTSPHDPVVMLSQIDLSTRHLPGVPCKGLLVLT
jgi:hypothetical protein